MREETNNGSAKEHRITWTNPLDRERMKAIEDGARDLDRQARLFIREHPASVVLAAVAVGFLIGRLVRR
jgi:ElaB/YqjD/DUF883 family membrane-anchored ribosome-binding protein